MNNSTGNNQTRINKPNQNIQVYVRVRPLNARERGIRSSEVIEVNPPKEIITRHINDSKLTKKFTFDRTFGPDSKQHEVYEAVVGPLIEEVLAGYNCTVFAYGQTGTGKTHTMVGTECAELKSSWEDATEIGIIPRALSHLFDELRMMELEFSMRISYLELYNEELCDLLSSEDSTKIRIFDDSTKKGSVIIQGLEEIPVHNKDDVYKLLEKGKERRKTATTLMNAQSSRSHTVFSILVHIKENNIDGEEMLKIGKLNLVDLAGSENVSKAGNEKGIRTRETVNINQSLLTLGRVITALVERTPHIPYRESKLTRLLQESLGGRTKTSIIATISPGHKDLEETLSTLEYAHRAKNIQNRPEVNQKLTKKTVLKEYTEEIDKLKRDLMAARDKNGIYLAEETYNDLQYKLDSQTRELNEKVLLLKALKDELANKEKIFNEVSLHLVEKAELLLKKDRDLGRTQGELQLTKKVLTTTKRRYKEKKVLLESHVKTEEILLNQANKLIEVADLATSDTVQLHDTIDRRRDVDAKIQTACEQFTKRMKESFQLMDENLSNLQTDHSSHSDLIIEEISKSTKLQNKFVSDAMNKFDSVSQICTGYVELLTGSVQKAIESVETSNSNHKSAASAILQQVEQVKDQWTAKLKESLSEMQSLFVKQKSIIEGKSRQIAEWIAEGHTTLSAHTEEMKAYLQGIAENSTRSLETEVVRLNANMNSREKLAARRKNALAEFMKQMEQMELEDLELTNAITSVVGNLQSSQARVTSVIGAGILTADEFSASRHQLLDHLQAECTSLETDTVANLEKCTAVSCSLESEQGSVQTHLANRLEDTRKSIETNCEEVSSILTSRKKEFDEEQAKFVAEHSKECETLRCLTKEENARLREHNTQNIALTTSLRNNVRDYARIYYEQMGHCMGTVETFRNNELKTYTPTGQTPSKKEFSYPKVLASTSPHNRIVKRLRQENDWSDLDMTINEENETTSELCDPEVILNSTPFNLSPIEKVNSKDPNSMKRDVSHNRKPPSRKNSPMLVPFSKENKENVF